jgi:pimeloyl-ACP methyl ester carboxylesterase
MDPAETFLDLPAGRFRALLWAGEGVPVLFLHGLTAIAEVWAPTIAALPPGNYAAIDQRGHGESPAPAVGYDIASYVADACATVRALGFERPHLVGHSMGARVAMVAAARHPELFRSVAIVDIGPEAWRENWRETVASIERMPVSFTREEALAFFTRNRPTPPDREALYLARLRESGDGRLTWRGSPHAWKETVISHRGRNFWRDWERLAIPTMLIRGGDSTELRARIFTEMKGKNARPFYRELPGVGHNIPLLAPAELAAELTAFWSSAQSLAQ